MKCPACIEVPLMAINRDEVEIDFCPRCRGVWLGRGGLDTLDLGGGRGHHDVAQANSPGPLSGAADEGGKAKARSSAHSGSGKRVALKKPVG